MSPPVPGLPPAFGVPPLPEPPPPVPPPRPPVAWPPDPEPFPPLSWPALLELPAPESTAVCSPFVLENSLPPQATSPSAADARKESALMLEGYHPPWDPLASRKTTRRVASVRHASTAHP